MAKFYGQIGFSVAKDDGYGQWIQEVVEKTYKGDIVRNTRRWDKGVDINDDLVISNSISVVADKFLTENLSAMKYLKWNGGYWKITNAEIQYPRIILTLGGVYNGPTPQEGTASST
jgi:hypothetical protein